MYTYLCLILNRYTKVEIAEILTVADSEEQARMDARNTFVTSEKGKKCEDDWYIDITSISTKDTP